MNTMPHADSEITPAEKRASLYALSLKDQFGAQEENPFFVGYFLAWALFPAHPQDHVPSSGVKKGSMDVTITYDARASTGRPRVHFERQVLDKA